MIGRSWSARPQPSVSAAMASVAVAAPRLPRYARGVVLVGRRLADGQTSRRTRTAAAVAPGFATLAAARLAVARKDARCFRLSAVPLRGSATAVFPADIGPPISVSATEPAAFQGSSLVVFLRASAEEDSPLQLDEVGAAVDNVLGGSLRAFADDERFDGKAGTSKTMLLAGQRVSRVVLVGIGPPSKDPDWRLAGATAAAALKGLRAGSAGFACAGGVCVQDLVEGIFLGLHTDRRFKGTQTPTKQRTGEGMGPSSIELLGALSAESNAMAERAKAVASGVVFARELVNAPANVVTPPTLAAAAAGLGARFGLKVKVLEEAECETMGMGAFLAVGRCSEEPSKFIHLVYSPPGGEVARKVGIVGKGLTFDSGGYNLKAAPGSMIELMKFDMGGAAATLGAAAAIAQLRPKGVEVHFVIAACENMISGSRGALHPGDIITAMDGTTIEVDNTDAEGRLTLADALLYCQNQGVTEIVDVATLTGACMVALGNDIAGMWSNCDDFAKRLETAAKITGEKIWRMPLEESYFDGMKSDLADMKNIGGRFGGAITAALFLSKFVRKEVKWAHIDIAGTAWADKPKRGNAAGGTGSMVRALTQLVVAEE